MERATPRVTSISSLIAGVLGIGHIGRGGGTVAAAVSALLWTLTGVHALPVAAQLAGIVALFALGTWAAGRMEQGWGRDSGFVVVDEFAGMALALFALPAGWLAVVIAFVLFRVFDIMKPFGIARMERLPGGWGVMADDLLAGIYANLIMQGLVRTNIWSWA
ncbi:MAG: phosphatidylglycerophosphatase A [Flavobacteriales bacterium]|nr:phosphatidylglycerophosphatase A [Flavobacteriales bacterium]MBP6696730.1 phosphatidylglycerophosphatase A [Flavobacteriales bacterium]